MRTELQKHDTEVITVTATFKRFATTNGRRNYLFKHVFFNGSEITDHIWIKNYKNHKSCKLERNAEYTLTGKVKKYYKNDKDGNKVIDYCIINPRVIKINL